MECKYQLGVYRYVHNIKQPDELLQHYVFLLVNMSLNFKETKG